MLSRTQSLPPSLVKLCNRLAAEQAKAETWRLGHQLRQEYARRLRGGESLAKLEADIQVQVLQAAREQLMASIAPARARIEAKAARQRVE